MRVFARTPLTLLLVSCLMLSVMESNPLQSVDELDEQVTSDHVSSGRSGNHIGEGDTWTWADGSYDLEDNLTVRAGATLTIINATLNVSASPSGLTYLKVAPGGYLNIVNSTLKANGTNTWVIESWGEVHIVDTGISGLGGTSSLNEQGAQFVGGNLSASNLSIEGGLGTGIVIDHANATLSASTIGVNGDGLHCISSSINTDDIIVIGGLVPIAIKDCAVTMNRTSISGHDSTGLFVEGGVNTISDMSIIGGSDGAIFIDTVVSLKDIQVSNSRTMGIGIENSTLSQWSNIDVTGVGGDGIILGNLSETFTGPSPDDRLFANQGSDIVISGDWMPSSSIDDLSVDLSGWMIVSGHNLTFSGLDLEVGGAVAGSAGLSIGGDTTLTLTNGSISPMNGGDWNIDAISSGTIVFNNMILIDPGQLEIDPIFAGLTLYSGTMQMNDVIVAAEFGPTLQVHTNATVVVNGGEFIGGEGIVVDGGHLSLTDVEIMSSYNTGLLAIDAYLTVNDLKISDPAYGGVFVSAPYYASITGLTVNNSDEWGVWIQDSPNTMVDDWLINGSEGEGLIIRDSSVTSVSSNSLPLQIRNTTSSGVLCENSTVSSHLYLLNGRGNGVNATGCSFPSVTAMGHLGWDASLRHTTLQFTENISQPGLLGRLIQYDSWSISVVDSEENAVQGPFILEMNTSMGQSVLVTIPGGGTSVTFEFITEVDDGRGEHTFLEWIDVSGGSDAGNISTERISIDASERGSRQIVVSLITINNPFSSLGGVASTGWFALGGALGLTLLLLIMYLVVRPVDDADEMLALAELGADPPLISDKSPLSSDDHDLSDLSFEEPESIDVPSDTDESEDETPVTDPSPHEDEVKE